MKKITTLCVSLFMLLVFAAPAAAQTFNWGLTGGLNLTEVKFTGKGHSNYDSETNPGFYIGPKIMFSTAIGLGFDVAMEYSMRNLEINSVKEKLHTLEFPINIRYNMGFGRRAGVYVSTGPQFGFALNNMSWSALGSGENFSRENLCTTWNVGAGLRLFGSWEIGVGYNFALAHTGRSIKRNFGGSVGNLSTQTKYRCNSMQIQLSHWF